MKVIICDECRQDIEEIRKLCEAYFAEKELDAEIESFSNGWKVERIAKVDLSILRLALYEMSHRQDVPESSAINEAVELAKKYGSDKSAKFINGVLGGISRQRNQKQESEVESIFGD